MRDEIKNGTVRDFDGKSCVYFDGYWLRNYAIHTDHIADKKQIIDQMTRRVFHHVEAGINTPGHHLDKVRAAYDAETCPKKKRVKAAMLAGSLLNRGRDILTAIVNLEDTGVVVERSNPLYKECGKCLTEALELGKNIKLNDGGEGNLELWGEPFRVYTMPMPEFFETRYIKLAQTMSEIDRVAEAMEKLILADESFEPIGPLLEKLVVMAKQACETLRSDTAMFEIWPAYISAKEDLFEKLDKIHVRMVIDRHENQTAYEHLKIIREGAELLVRHTNLRVPMPESVAAYIEKCNTYWS